MPRKWEGKWFRKSSGKKGSRVNGRGRPKKGSLAVPSGQFPQIQVVFQRANEVAPMPQPPKSAQRPPKGVRAAYDPQSPVVIRTPVKVDDPKPQVTKRGRHHRRGSRF